MDSKIFLSFVGLAIPLFLLISSSIAEADQASVLDQDRQKLFAQISGMYWSDGVPVDVPDTTSNRRFLENMQPLGQSTDPFVSKFAQNAVQRSNYYQKMYDASFQIRCGGNPSDISDAGNLVIDRANDDLLKFGHDFLNSDGTIRIFLADAINAETSAESSDDAAEQRRELLSDGHNHPRGQEADLKSFPLEFGTPDGWRLQLKVVNQTGTTLHNALLVDNVKIDKQKLAAKKAADQGNLDLSHFLQAAADPGPQFLNARTKLEKAQEHQESADIGGQVFVPEWKPGQAVEVTLLCAANMDTVMPGQLAILSDEYSPSNIELSLDQMNAGFHNRVSPPMPKPVDPNTLHALTQQQHDSMQIFLDNQVLTYKFLAYPGFMSEPIVAPLETLHMRTGRVDDGAVNVQIDGHTVDTGLAAPVVKPGSWVCYQAQGTKPVGIIVQFFERDLQSGEDQPLDLTAASFAQTSGTSAMIDTATNKLVALIKDHPGFVGTRTNSNGNADPAEAQLNWNADRHLIEGVIIFPKFANSKNVIGRIINNAGNGPVLELVETSAAHLGNGDGTVGVYFLSLSPEGNSLIGKWSFHNSGMWLVSDDRSASITLGIKAPSVAPGMAEPPVDQSLVMAQHQSVQITVGNRLIIYRLTAYPGFWSEAAVAPNNVRHIIVKWEQGAQLQAQVDGNDVDPASLSCQPGSRVRFRAMGDKPVVVALRFLQREPSEQERGHLEVLPSPDDDTRDPPPNRQPLRDALIAFVQGNPSLTGDLRQRRQNLHVNMEITWDDKIEMATGSIEFPELNAKKKFEGRIIDDQMNPPYLQLVETGLVDPKAATNANIGMVYSLHLAGRGTSLIGSWSYRAVGADGFSQQSDSGMVKISANPQN